MNILFITQHQVTSQKGGIERITDIVTKSLPSKYTCFSAYQIPTDLTPTEFVSAIHLVSNKEYELLKEFITNNNIDIIINQQCLQLDKVLYKLKRELNFKSFFFQHDVISEPWKAQKRDLKYSLALNFKPSLFLKYHLFTIYRLTKKIVDYIRYKQIYLNNNGVLILSNKYKRLFLQTIGATEDSAKKISIINNCITLSKFQPKFISRDNTVLIVSRMSESRKRIFLALEIWKKLNIKYPELSHWKLILAGDGEFLESYKNFTKQHKLKNIEFKGQVDSTLPLYLKAKIFMMTSHSEGWGLTLTEAQQMGVVPIAFNSYPAIEDIIDNTNGILVTEGDIDGYVDNLANLMTNPKMLIELSNEATKVTTKYSIDKVIKQWTKVLD